MNKPKAIGTAAETAVVNFLRDNGFSGAERRALRGVKDGGDITGTPGITWEVKGGKKAKEASDNQIALWLVETEKERENTGDPHGVLVVQRAQRNPRDWWAVMWSQDFVTIADPGASPILDHWRDVPVRLQLQHMVSLLRWSGHGDEDNADGRIPDVVATSPAVPEGA